MRNTAVYPSERLLFVGPYPDPSPPKKPLLPPSRMVMQFPKTKNFLSNPPVRLQNFSTPDESMPRQDSNKPAALTHLNFPVPITAKLREDDQI